MINNITESNSSEGHHVQPASIAQKMKTDDMVSKYDAL